jgi:transcription initiation factor TFIIH subunit 4
VSGRLGQARQQKVGKQHIDGWQSKKADVWTSEKEHALDLLQRYHITVLSSSKTYTLTENFARSLRHALSGGGNAKSFGEIALLPSNPAITVDDLDQFARNQWEGILGYMVGNSAIPLESSSTIVEPSPGVIELLKAGHLIELTGTSRLGHSAKITKDGFAFVLQDINTQVWSLLFLYVDHAEDFAMTKVAVLSFLFLISSLELGQAYRKSHLDENQLRILSDLSDFGIIYQSSADSADFYPTRLATTLTSDSHTSSTDSDTNLSSSLTTSSTSQSHGFIIIETNYRIYAYTSSPLQTSLLALFTNLRSRHPNLITAKMTKSSVQRAVQAGITAEQIISYLSSHAHPQMRRHANAAAAAASDPTKAAQAASVIPATVLDQIHLWQIEKDRMTTTPGYLMKAFATQAEYERYCQFADQIGVLVWRSDRKRMFFVNQIESLRRFMKSSREDGGGGD